MPGVAAIAGHRPNKLGGYRIPNHIFNSVMEGMDKKMMELQPDMVITGMAIGVDQWAAELCIFNGIPFIAAIPCEQHESRWPPYVQEAYRQLLAQAHQIVLVSNGLYEPWKMQARNEWMVNRSDYVIAVWDGTPGGTANCLAYADSVRKLVHFCDFIRPQPVAPYIPSSLQSVEPIAFIPANVPAVTVTEYVDPEIAERRERRRRERQEREAQRLREAAERATRLNQSIIEIREQSEGNRRAREEARRALQEEAAEMRRVQELLQRPVQEEVEATPPPARPVEEKEEPVPRVTYGRFVDLS